MPTESARSEHVQLAENVAILVARTYGEAGYRKTGPYHLVNRDQVTRLSAYPEYQGSTLLQTWCGGKIRMGPAEILHGRSSVGKWAPGGLFARLCLKCFSKQGARRGRK